MISGLELGVVLLRHCDKHNHGWREGPQRPFPSSFDLLAVPSPSRQSQFRTKEVILRCFGESRA